MLESYKNKNNLLDKQWYLSKMSMFLKESYGIVEETEWQIYLLNNINDVCDDVIRSIDIYTIAENLIVYDIDNPDKKMKYEEIMQKMDKENVDFKSLDIIASLVGISRNVKINNVWIKLSNYELWQYILIIIIKNNYKGTNEELNYLYSKINLNIEYQTIDAMQCSIKLKLDSNYTDTMPHIPDLFKNHNITIESLGVHYEHNYYIGEETTFTLDSESNLDSYRHQLIKNS